MNIRNALHLTTVAVVLAGGTSLMAQVTTGALNGSVTDEQGNPIVGARVVLESPALFQPRVYSTNAKGEYRALLLPVGNYTIKVSASGKLSKTATDVRVGVGTNLSMPFILKAQKAVETATVEVVSEMAAEAKTSDKVSVNYSAEQLMQMPVGLNFNDAIQLAPGVSGYGTSAAIRGSGWNQIQYRVDGINVQDSSGKSASLYTPLPDSIEDVQVVLSALNARNGSVQGGQMNMVTKSGSNTFEGSVRLNINRQSWGSDVTHMGAQAINDNHNENFNRTLDITASGPILKDRIWFYIGARFEPSTPNTNYLGQTFTARSNKLMNPRWADSTIQWENLYGPQAYQIGGDANDAPFGDAMNGATYLRNVRRGILAPMATYGINRDVDAVIYQGPGYAGINTKRTDSYADYADQYGMNGVLMDMGSAVSTTNKHEHIEAKLTGAVTDTQSLAVTLLYDKFTMGNNMGEHTTTAQQMVNKAWVSATDDKTVGYTFNWNGTIASNWTIEARASQAKYTSDDPPAPAPGETSLQAYWATTDPSLVLWQNQSQVANAGVYGTNQTLNLGPVEVHDSVYSKPRLRGNRTASVNIKTFQDLFGQHEIDFGGEFLQTMYNEGYTKEIQAQVFCGGMYSNGKGGELYPVIMRGDDGRDVLDIAPSDLNADTALWESGTGVSLRKNMPYVHSWELSMRSPGAHVEHYFVSPDDSKNEDMSYWFNDIYTINSQWNVLVGVRYSTMKLKDRDKTNNDSTVTEPRFQVKYNPDGKNANVFSFSVAKLAAAYSDSLANNFRGQEWEVRTVQRWTGAALDSSIAQPGFDTVAGQNDVSTQDRTGNGYTYLANVNYHGVRFVDYAAITNLDNYGKISAVYNAPFTSRAETLTSPYTVEYNLGYTRNYATGRFSINLVDRVYKNNWVYGWRDYGTEYMLVVPSPAPGDNSYQLNQGTVNYTNSDNSTNYTSLEINFDKQITSRLKMSGSYTWSEQTGKSDMDYYNYRSLRNTLLTPEQANSAVGDGYLGKSNIAHLVLTYVHPVGKGNVSFSFRANSWTGDIASVKAWTAYKSGSSEAGYNAITDKIEAQYGPVGSDMCQPINTRGGYYAGSDTPAYATYFGKMGDYKRGIDNYDTSLRVQADIPLGLGKTRLVGYFSIFNLFNHGIVTNVNQILNGGGFGGPNTPGVSNAPSELASGGIAGRVTGSFLRPYGQPGVDGSAAYGNNGDGGARYVTDFSIGLKF